MYCHANITLTASRVSDANEDAAARLVEARYLRDIRSAHVFDRLLDYAHQIADEIDGSAAAIVSAAP